MATFLDGYNFKSAPFTYQTWQETPYPMGDNPAPPVPFTVGGWKLNPEAYKGANEELGIDFEGIINNPSNVQFVEQDANGNLIVKVKSSDKGATLYAFSPEGKNLGPVGNEGWDTNQNVLKKIAHDPIALAMILGATGLGAAGAGLFGPGVAAQTVMPAFGAHGLGMAEAAGGLLSGAAGVGTGAAAGAAAEGLPSLAELASQVEALGAGTWEVPTSFEAAAQAAYPAAAGNIMDPAVFAQVAGLSPASAAIGSEFVPAMVSGSGLLEPSLPFLYPEGLPSYNVTPGAPGQGTTPPADTKAPPADPTKTPPPGTPPPGSESTLPQWMKDLGLDSGLLKAALPLLGAAAGYFDAKNANGKSQGNEEAAAWFKNRANTPFAPPQFSTGLMGQQPTFATQFTQPQFTTGLLGTPWGRY